MLGKFQVSIPNPITENSRISECNPDELEPLKYICSVNMGSRRFESELTKRQKEVLERIYFS